MDNNKENRFRKELLVLLHSTSIGKGSNTPDFILAEYLLDCLRAFDRATNKRNKLFNSTTSPTGFLDRHVHGLPKEICTMDIIVIDGSKEKIVSCMWRPYKQTEYTNANKKGYIGTAVSINGVEHYGAWEQNNGDFIFYKIL